MGSQMVSVRHIFGDNSPDWLRMVWAFLDIKSSGNVSEHRGEWNNSSSFNAGINRLS